MIGPIERQLLDRYRETDLLALIEQELEPAERDALLAQLAADPEARAIVKRLETDRTAMRSIGDPVMPRDFLSALEPRLARPMLMETASSPGSYRRRHRPRRNPWAVARYSVAAVVAMAALAALWAGVTGALVPALGPTDEAIANQPADPSSTVASNEPTTAESLPPDGAVVHHARPLPAPATAPPPTPEPDVTPRDPLVPYVLVLDASSSSEAEGALSEVLGSGSGGDAPAVLVRNFSFEEASRLARSIRVDPGDAPTAVSSVDGAASSDASFDRGRWERLAKSLRRIRRDRTETADVQTGVVLLGDESVGPSYEEQLELSSHGATHTLTVTAGEIVDVLRRLTVEADQPCTVRPLIAGADVEAPQPNRGGDVAPTVLQQWISDLGAVQQMLDDLRSRDADEVVHLPLVIDAR